jgi:type III secretory pathway lipoprotein EscJ
MAWETAKNLLARARARMGALARPASLGAIALGALALGGLFWLVLSDNRGDMVVVSDAALAPGDVAVARDALGAAGIRAEVRANRLMVPRSALSKARDVLADGGLLHPAASASPVAAPAAGLLEQAAREDDIWRSEAQNDKRWLAAKMATLKGLIETLPGIKSATVILEPGQPRRVGAPPVAATAAVQVKLADESRMSQSLAEAIADMVAASTANMSRQNVCIVDSAGRSWRAGAVAATGDAESDRTRTAEAAMAERIRSALSHIDGVLVSVRAAVVDGEVVCQGVSISVPRSHLRAVARAEGAPPVAATDVAGPLATAQLQRVLATTTAIAGDQGRICVEWYYDRAELQAAEPRSAAPLVVTVEPPGGGWAIAGIGGGSVLLLALTAAGGVWYWRRKQLARRGRRLLGWGGAESAKPQGALAALRQASVEELAAFIQPEHPQTIAVILAHLPPAKAAGALDALGPQRQAEVARRLADLGSVDAAVVREVESGLAERLAQTPLLGQVRLDGPQKLARILSHTQVATERNIVGELARTQPELLEGMQRRMLTFEDVVHLPVHRLRPALGVLGEQELAIALRTSGRDVRDLVLSALPARLARAVRENIERMGPVRLSDVETAQERVVELIRSSQQGQYIAATGAEATRDRTA